MLQKYMEELSKITLLTLEEEMQLWHSYKEEGLADARMRLIENYQPLVFKAAKPFLGVGMDEMDILQEGTVGLIESVERFDHTKGIAFSLYSSHRIRGRILDFLRREGKKDTLLADLCAEHTWWEQVPDSEAFIEDYVEEKAFRICVAETVQALSGHEKVVLQEVCMKGTAVKDVASLLETSQSYIYRLQRQGLEKLKSLVDSVKDEWDR